MVTKAQAKTILDLISKFIPKSNYKKAKHTNGGKFKVASTGQPYTGFYIEDSRGNFIAGETPEEKGPDLVEIPQDAAWVIAKPTGLLLQVLQRELTQNELQQGSIKRYFTQDLHNANISEVLPETYFADKQDTLRKNTLEIDWITKGPADDRIFGKYPYQGAESKNRETIQEANNNMPGISTYISDYRYLVQETAMNNNMSTSTSIEQPGTTVSTTSALSTADINTTVAGITKVASTTTTTATTTSTSTTYTEDALIQETTLENSRKANFDTRK